MAASSLSRLLAAVVSGFVLLWVFVVEASADEWQLVNSPGICNYELIRSKSDTETICTAKMIALNSFTSEAIECVAKSSGFNRMMHPSAAEYAPDSIKCSKLGRIFDFDGDYRIRSADDLFQEERSKVRRKGTFTWSNGTWVFSAEGEFQVRFCVVREHFSNPDLGIFCSKDISWNAK